MMHRTRHILFLANRFTKLTQAKTLRTTIARNGATAFCKTWIFKYGPPKMLLSDNETEFASRLFQNVYQLMVLYNVSRSPYHPQTIGQVERYNRTLLTILRNYVNEQQSDRGLCLFDLTCAYSNHVHQSMKSTSFGFVLSRSPPPLSLHHSISAWPAPD